MNIAQYFSSAYFKAVLKEIVLSNAFYGHLAYAFCGLLMLGLVTAIFGGFVKAILSGAAIIVVFWVIIFFIPMYFSKKTMKYFQCGELQSQQSKENF
jgi:hypothetical protein